MAGTNALAMALRGAPRPPRGSRVRVGPKRAVLPTPAVPRQGLVKVESALPRRLPPPPTVAHLLKIFNIQARKQLSQNFILDPQVLDKIARHIVAPKAPAGVEAPPLGESDLVVEVGPGPGGITRAVVGQARVRGLPLPHLVVVEKDERFLAPLQRLAESCETPFAIMLADMLALPHREICAAARWSPQALPQRATLFGNLPFNVSTALLVQWLHLLAAREGFFSLGSRTRLVLTFQKEVAERLAATPGTSQWSRLSVLTQAQCRVRTLYALPASVFTPRPAVDSLLVELTPLPRPLLQTSSFALEALLSGAFSMRRKILRNSFVANYATGPSAVERALRAEGFLHAVGASAEQRPEELTVTQWCSLARLLVDDGFLDEPSLEAAGRRRWQLDTVGGSLANLLPNV